MADNLYTIFSYNNYELKIMVFSNSGKKSFLLFEEIIEKVNLNEITSDLTKDKISIKIKEVLVKATQITKKPIKQVYLVYDPDSYHYTSRSFVFDFPEEYILGEKDLTKMYSHIMNSEVARDESRVVNFNIKSLQDQDGRKIDNPIGMKLEKLKISGELVYSDSKTYYSLVSLIQTSEVKIIDARVGAYLLKEKIQLADHEGIMEVGTEKINFIVNQNDVIKQFSINWGFRKMLESMYEALRQNHSAEASEEAVRFLMEYFPLEEYKTDITLIEDLKLDSLIRRFQSVLVEYFTYIFEELEKQKITVDYFNVLVHEYNEPELIAMLDETLSVKLNRLIINEYKHVSSEDVKAYLAVDSFLAASKFTK